MKKWHDDLSMQIIMVEVTERDKTCQLSYGVKVYSYSTGSENTVPVQGLFLKEQHIPTRLDRVC